MTGLILVAILGLAFMAIADFRRRAAIRCIERTERLRMRFSQLRHELVMHAGSGEMRPQEKNAFYFLYPATTFMLRHPRWYPSISRAFCAVLMAPPNSPPKLEKRDLSPATMPILREYVAACDELVQQFADVRVLIVAYLSGESVVDCVRNIGRRHRELMAERERISRWREVGAGALGPSGMAAAH